MKKSKKMFILTETVLAAVLLLMIAAMLREKRAGHWGHARKTSSCWTQKESSPATVKD